MVGLGCSIASTVIGAVAVVLVSSIGFGVIPMVIEKTIINNFVLFDDSLQWERFKETPFPLNVSIHIFNITNPDAVLQGATPRVQEVGPYVYRLYQERIIEDTKEDSIKYRFRSRYEFDAITSYPLTEDDQLTIVNLAYNAILQVVEQDMPTLMGVVNSAIDSVFGEHNEPITKVRVGSLILDGLSLCQDPGFIGQIVCSEIRASAEGSRNLETQEDKSVLFSLFNYKRAHLSEPYETFRGKANPADLGRITAWNDRGFLPYWMEAGSRCNMVNGTDTGIYRPFIKRDQVIQAFNMDICRSVELRYQYDTEFDGIPVARYAANEWFLSNEEGCFCLKVTKGINRPDGCLLSGAMELYTCSGSFTVLTYPHFLFADQRYTNGVIGMTPDLESHRIFLDIQLDTGVPVRGGKRAQVNVFLRPIQGIKATANLTTTLTPIFWLQEGMQLPEELRAEMKDQLLAPLRLINILVPVFMAIACLALLLGSYLLYGALRRNRAQNTKTEDTTNVKGEPLE